LEPGKALLKISQATAFWQRMQAESTDTNDRNENLTEMAMDVDDYCSKKANNTLAGYLQNISLLTSEDDADDDKSIKLMTLHGCKGLEFDSVFISHCNEGVLPHARIAEEAKSPAEYEQAVEEERRLLYVGMTRAKKSLTLCFANFKIDARSRKPRPVFPSKFLYETGIHSLELASAHKAEEQE
jgi:DNA helicase-2/ATP-dependent DNA helicase PcrA